MCSLATEFRFYGAYKDKFQRRDYENMEGNEKQPVSFIGHSDIQSGSSTTNSRANKAG